MWSFSFKPRKYVPKINLNRDYIIPNKKKMLYFYILTKTQNKIIQNVIVDVVIVGCLHWEDILTFDETKNNNNNNKIRFINQPKTKKKSIFDKLDYIIEKEKKVRANERTLKTRLKFDIITFLCNRENKNRQFSSVGKK